MKKLTALFLCLLTTLSAIEPVEQLPIMHKGRIRPFSSKAAHWLEEVWSNNTLPTTHVNPSILLLNYHLFGINRLKNLPLIPAPNIHAVQELGLPPKELYSFEELDESLQQADTLLKEVITYNFAKASSTKQKSGTFTPKELADLSTGLVVALQGGDLVVKKRAKTGPLRALKEETVALKNAKKHLDTFLVEKGGNAEDITRLLQRMALLDPSQDKAELEYNALADNLINEGVEPKKIAERLNDEYPLLVRLHSFSDPLIMLPSKYDPTQWVPLKALGLKKYDESLNALAPINNFTLFSDEDFQRIQNDYLELIHILENEALQTPFDPTKGYTAVIKREINRFAKSLMDAYTPLSDQHLINRNQSVTRFPSLNQLKAEHYYLQLPSIKAVVAVYIFALIALILDLMTCSMAFNRLGSLLTIFGFILHTTVLVFRIYILERPPVATMYETLLYTPWVSTLLALILNLKNSTPIVLIISNIIAITLLSLSFFNEPTASLETIQPVLRSHFWLMIHVLMIVASYGIFIFAGILGHFRLITWLFNREYLEIIRLTLRPLISSLYIGVILLICGTILGGIWANMSWGRFWDWDPKESWALISSLTYLAIIHLYRIGAIHQFGISFGACLGLLSITFTWYGVNYLLGSGLHSYGFSTGGAIYYMTYIAIECAFLAFCLIRFLTTKRKWEINPPIKSNKKI